MPTHRYANEDDYTRERAQRRERERDREIRDPRESRDVRDRDRGSRMEVDNRALRGDIRMSGDPLDRISEARDQRANTTARIENRGGRTVRGQQDDEMMYDIRGGQTYGQTTRREPSYDEDFSDIPAPVRPVIDPGPRLEKVPRPSYNEYFLPGEGIDREVIQSEICRFLGQDATCKPGLHTDGRRGYIIRGYRALTTEMIRSLKEDSAKYQRERERAAARNQRAVPYATMRDQMQYEEDNMITSRDPDRMDFSSVRGQQFDNPRTMNARENPGAGYIQDPGLTSYQPVSSMQSQLPGYDPRFVPGAQVGAGNTTPPSSRTPGYAGTGYSTTTRAPAPAMPPAYNPGPDSVRGAGQYQSDNRRYR